MEILRDPNFDFMKYRRFWVAVSLATILAGLVGIFFFDRLNFGVDFAGGTQINLKFREQPDVQELRELIASAGIREAVIQTFGEEGSHEFIVRTPIIGGSEEGSASLVLPALNQRYNPELRGTDLNQVGAPTLAELLVGADPDGVGAERARDHYTGVAESVMGQRKTRGLFSSWDEVAAAGGLSPAALERLRGSSSLGSFSVLGLENVSPQVGAELRQRGILAVVGAIIGMLLYIWVRFELRFGIGATMATLHDVLITLGLYAWAGYEFNLTTIAAFLTLIGYSVNDTVVTFDRVRENLRKSRSQDTLTLLNRSINQTLSRTVLTGGTTILVSLVLFLYGGDVIRGFAFVMVIGVVVGTYSSIFIASPFALLWEQWFGARGRGPAASEPPRPARAAR
jgi:preprotein translocase subunit SecF